jgi:sugar/nucleoside kinase (ribokinase family)
LGDAQVPVAISEAVVDPTGAGDSFSTAFMNGILAGFSPEECAKLGRVVASYCIEKHAT